MGVRTRAERIIKNVTDTLLHMLCGIDRDRGPQLERKQSDVVHSMKMIGMFVREEDAMRDPNPFPIKLKPKFR